MLLNGQSETPSDCPFKQSNYATNWNGEQIKKNPTGSHYGLVMQKIQLVK